MPQSIERLTPTLDKATLLLLCTILVLILSGCGNDTLKPSVTVSCNTFTEPSVILIEPDVSPMTIKIATSEYKEYILDEGTLSTDSIGNATFDEVTFEDTQKTLTISTSPDDSFLFASKCIPNIDGSYPTTERDIIITVDKMMSCTENNEGGGRIILYPGSWKQNWLIFNNLTFYLQNDFPGVVVEDSNDRYYVNNLGELVPFVGTPSPDMIATVNPDGYQTTTGYLDVHIFNDTANTGGLVFDATCDVPATRTPVPATPPTATLTSTPTFTPTPSATPTKKPGWGDCLDHCNESVVGAYKRLARLLE